MQGNPLSDTQSVSNGVNPQSFIDSELGTPDDKATKYRQNGYLTKQVGLDDSKYRPNFITNTNDEMDMWSDPTEYYCDVWVL